MTNLREHYRTLELDPDASDDELRDAWRDLTKVWHPDRFGTDERLRRRAEERLKVINEAYDAIRAARQMGSGSERGRWREPSAAASWKVRDSHEERAAPDLETILAWVARGWVVATDEIWVPRESRWIRVVDLPEARAILDRRGSRRAAGWAISLAITGVFLLFRRPGGGGAVIAIVLFVLAAILWIGATARPR